MFVREGQRVQESSVQQHQLVVDLSDLQWPERRHRQADTDGDGGGCYIRTP